MGITRWSFYLMTTSGDMDCAPASNNEIVVMSGITALVAEERVMENFLQ
jgi:hypothetical protein